MLGFAYGLTDSDGTLPYVMKRIKDPTAPSVFKVSELVNCPSLKQTITKKRLKQIYLEASDVKQFVSSGSYLWEYFGERIRKEKFPDLQSRLDSYFLFTNKESAEYYIQEWKTPNMIIVQAEPIGDYNSCTLDMGKWDVNFNNMNYIECEKAISEYWLSHKQQKIPEVLVRGKVRLF